MIHSFSCKNFYSFAEKTSVDFTVNEKTPQNNGYFIAPSSTRLSKIETVIGPNASGKTNLLKVLPFLKWLIVDSYNLNSTALIPFKQFAFCEKKDCPSEFSVNFEIDEDIFIYKIILNPQKILEEELKIQNKTNKRETKKTLFSRKWNLKENKYDFVSKNFGIPQEFENLFLRTNASVISAAVRTTHELSKKIAQFWQKMQTNVVEAGWIGNELQNPMNMFEIVDFYIENEKIKKAAEKLLSRFDLGFKEFKIKKEKKENGFSISFDIIHSYNNHEYSLPLPYQSSGTRQLFVLSKTILQVLSHGGFAVLDELDAYLHPDIVSSLFELFISKETNPYNAQILFSTHSHRILSELDKYQIVLTEKNKNGSSETWRLDEMSGVRSDDNYYAKYMSGAYGAIPKIF